MISPDLQEIQKTKKVKDSGIRSKLRKIVWIISLLICIASLSIGHNIEGYFVASIARNIIIQYQIVIIASIFHILAKYIDSSLLTIDLVLTLSIGYFLAFTTIILIPVDTAVAIRNENLFKESPQLVSGLAHSSQNSYLYDERYYTLWKVIYWVMMVLNMFIMNVQNLFHKTGHLFFCSRILATIISYIKLCLVFVIPYIIGCIVIFIFTKSFGIGVMTQVFLLLSNIYGITVLVLLIGYGLVQFPYSLWSKTNRNNALDILLARAEPLYNRYTDAQTTVMLASQKMQAIINKLYDGHELFTFGPMLINEIPNLDEYRSYKSSTKSSNSNLAKHIDDLPEIITENVLALARFQLKSSKYNFVKVFNKWKQHCDAVYKIIEMESLNQKKNLASPTKKQEKQNSIKHNSSLASKFLTTSFQDIQKDYKQLEPIQMETKYVVLYRVMAVITGIFSILIIYSETALIFSTNNNQAIVFMRIVKDSTNIGGLIFLILLVLGYIIYCSCFALFQIDLGAGFEIYPYHTHPLTMMFNSKTCGTIVFPLCYNVMLIFNQVNNSDLTVHSGFDIFFRPMQSVPFFGNWYNLIVCLMISLIGILSLFKSLKRLVKMLTKNKIDMGTDDVEIEKIQQGEKWVINEWERRKKMQMITKLQNRDNDQENNKNDQDHTEEKLGFWQKIKNFFTFKREKQNDTQQELTETALQPQKPSKLAQIINKKKESESTYDGQTMNGRKKNVEDSEIIIRVKYQQQLEKEISLEDMVNGRGKKQYSQEIDLNDSYFESKSEAMKIGDSNDEMPSFEVIHHNDEEQMKRKGIEVTKQDMNKRQTLSQSNYYNNKIIDTPSLNIHSISHTDSSSQEHQDQTESEQSSSQIRQKKKAFLLPTHTQTNPNSARSNDSYNNQFEVNVNGNNVKHIMFKEQNRQITENSSDYGTDQQFQDEQRNRANHKDTLIKANEQTRNKDQTQENDDASYYNSDFINEIEKATNQSSFQYESYSGFASGIRDRILPNQDIQSNYNLEEDHHQPKSTQYDNQKEDSNINNNVQDINRSASQSLSHQLPCLNNNNNNNINKENEEEDVAENRQSNISNVSQKSLKLNLSGIKASIDGANYQDMNQLGEIEYKKDRKKKQKIKKIHKRMIEKGKQIADMYDDDSDAYDDDQDQEGGEQDIEKVDQQKDNTSNTVQAIQSIPDKQLDDKQNQLPNDSDNSDDLEEQMTRGRSIVSKPIEQMRPSLINVDGGWVYKKSENKMMRKIKGWTKKYLVVKSDSITYYEGQNLQKKGNEIQMRDIINVYQYDKDPRKAKKKEEDQDRHLRFIIYTKDRQYDFKTENEQQTIEWVDHIQNMVLRYQKQNKK